MGGVHQHFNFTNMIITNSFANLFRVNRGACRLKHYFKVIVMDLELCSRFRIEPVKSRAHR